MGLKGNRMADVGPAAPRLRFTYEPMSDEYDDPKVCIGDGRDEVCISPTLLFGNPLLDLMESLALLFEYGGEAHYDWWDEPGRYHWTLRREGDVIHIEIIGSLEFLARDDLWSFAHKVRLAASRLAAWEDGKRPGGGDGIRKDAGYIALSRLLDER
jgi:hypothetical protein